MRKLRLRGSEWFVQRYPAGSWHSPNSCLRKLENQAHVSDVHYCSHMDRVRTMSITLGGVLTSLPLPSSVTSDDGSLSSRRDEDGQGQVPGPQWLWVWPHVQHPGQGLRWLKLHSWKWVGPPALPHMGPNSVPSFQSPPNYWHKALASCHPVPTRDGSTAEDLSYKSNSNCQQHQALGLGSNTKGFPSSLLLSCWDWVCSWIPLGLDPFPGTLTHPHWHPQRTVCMYQHSCNKWADLSKLRTSKPGAPRISCCHLQTQDSKEIQTGILLGVC